MIRPIADVNTGKRAELRIIARFQLFQSIALGVSTELTKQDPLTNPFTTDVRTYPTTQVFGLHRCSCTSLIPWPRWWPTEWHKRVGLPFRPWLRTTPRNEDAWRRLHEWVSNPNHRLRNHPMLTQSRRCCTCVRALVLSLVFVTFWLSLYQSKTRPRTWHNHFWWFVPRSTRRYHSRTEPSWNVEHGKVMYRVLVEVLLQVSIESCLERFRRGNPTYGIRKIQTLSRL